MFEAMDVINAFGTPLKLAWVGWIAWGIGQYFWFRHERSMPTVKKVTSVASPTVKKTAVPKTVAAQVAEAPVVGRLITPTHVVAEAKPTVAAAPQPNPEPTPAPSPLTVPAPSPMGVSVADAAAPVFDPANAVIEQFGMASDSVLDKFVRDFEMQDARPRRRRTRPPETAPYGAEAPQVP